MLRSATGVPGMSLAVALILAGGPGTARGQFALFVNETFERSVALGSLFANDVEEKDYAWGDVDNDGDIDLVIVRKEPLTTTGKKVNVLLINENGVLVDRTSTFARASDVFLDIGFETPTNDRDVVLVDVDGDGWLDIVTAPTLTDNQAKAVSHPRVYINLRDDPPGSGNWQGFEHQDARIPQMHPTAGPRFCAVAAGDLTGDGAPDLYFADYDTPGGQIHDYQNKLLINDGNGFFADESVLRMGTLYNYGGNVGLENYLFSSFGTAAAIADMNNDGVNDVVKQTALFDPYHQAVVYNRPDNEGFFNRYDVTEAPGGYFISLGHLNGDGILDIVVTLDGTDQYLIGTTLDVQGQRNYENHAFPSNSSGFGGNSVIRDINNDGLNDVIITAVDVDSPGCSGTTHVYRNLGGDPPMFASVETTLGIPEDMLTGGHDVAVFDLNGDGWLDLVHGRCAGTQIWIQHPWGVLFDFPQGRPVQVAPDEAFTFEVQLTPIGGTVAGGTATLHYAINDDDFTSVLMTDLGGNLYEAALPPAACLDRISFYLTVTMAEEGVVSTDPADAPASTYTAVTADVVEVTLLNNFEAGEDLSDWLIVSDPSLTTGEWEQADPNGTIFGPYIASPEDDATPGAGNVMAFITENGPPGGSFNANDVDGGPTWLTSPSIDLQDSNALISYARWFFSFAGEEDLLTVEVSNDGTDWTVVEIVAGTDGQWEVTTFLVSDFVEPSANVQVRFQTSDFDSSVTEAGLDDFQVTRLACAGGCPWDCGDNDGTVGIVDFLALLAQWGGPGPCDLDGSGVGITDFLELLANWGPCP